MQQLNQELFLLINQLAGQHAWFDSFVIRLAGLTPYVFIVLLIAMWFFANPQKRYASFLAGGSVLLAMLLSYCVGKLFFHPRPFMDGLGVQLMSHAPDTSFPSDHTTFVFAIAFSLLFSLANKSLGWFLVVVSLLSGIARVYVAVHYPGDIAGALVIGAIAAAIVFFINQNVDWLRRFYTLFDIIRLPNKRKN